MKTKKELRAEIRSKIRLMGLSKPRIYPALLENLQNFALIRESSILLAFLAIAHEPDLTSFLQVWLDSGKRLFLPRFNSSLACYELAEVSNLKQDIVLGFFKIKEPSPLLPKVAFPADSQAICLLPGLAFSKSGARLGRGAGYYDRLLQDEQRTKIGVCLDFQLLDEIPVRKHDVGMDYIVTETHIVKCSKKNRIFG